MSADQRGEAGMAMPWHDARLEVVPERISRGLRQVSAAFPYLTALVAQAQVSLDDRVPTMGVFASGRLIVNAGFAARLDDAALRFVLAHEILHLALRTHARAVGANRMRFNQAHDYIINDVLRIELGVSRIPAGGLDMADARHRSAEELMLTLREQAGQAPVRMWIDAGEAGGSGGDGMGQGPGSGQDGHDDGDVLDDALEREWFGESAAQQRARQRRAREAAARGVALAGQGRGRGLGALAGVLGVAGAGRGTAPGNGSAQMQACGGLQVPLGGAAVQRWLEAVAMGDRSYARPSRRGSLDDDAVRPGRRREGWLMNLVLDTSGSMQEILPPVLGAVARFAEATAVDQVRVIQCDAAVMADDCIDPSSLQDYRIDGFGGSDLTPALTLLGHDASVRSAVVVTDGEITFPDAAPPFSVLWLLTPGSTAASFSPPYGQIVQLQAAGAAYGLGARR